MTCVAQTKNEKESRIRVEQFPEEAASIVNTVIESVKRIRYYKEIDNDNESYESKFKFKKHWYSVEFDKDGTFEDVEVTIKERHIPEAIKLNIKSYLETHFDRFDFIKIQEQYLYESEGDAKQFLNTVLQKRPDIASYYELVVATKTNKNWSIQEMTFDSNGAFLNSRPVEQDSYEYIMY